MVIVGALLAFLSRKMALRTGQALIIAVVAVPAMVVFFQLCDGLIEASDGATRAIVGFGERFGGGDKIIAPPAMSDLFWSTIGFVGIGITGGILTLESIIFAMLIVVVKFLTLPALVLDPWLGRARSMLEWCISIGLVSMLLFRPIAAFFLVLGRAVTYPLQSVAFTVIGIICGLVLASWAGWKLVKTTHKVVGDVSAAARSRMEGKVETYTRQNTPATKQQVQNIHMGGMHKQPKLNRTQALGLAVRQQRHAKAVAGITARITTTSNPHLRAALVIYRRAKLNRPPTARRIRPRR